MASGDARVASENSVAEAPEGGARLGVPRSPVVLDRAFADPDAVRALVPRHAPYWPVLRYAMSPSELAAVGGNAEAVSTPPWFRGDWAYTEPLVEGAEQVLANPIFREAAAKVFDAAVVVPQVVYVNLMGPMPSSGPPHIDVPAFRGLDRRQAPVWLLHVMHRSGLFAHYKIDIATAVAWFYEGEGGAFEYWPEGAEGNVVRLEAPLSNRAVVGDNDVMFHRVGAIGAPSAPAPEKASLESELRPLDAQASAWAIVDGERECIRYEADALRISVSWKAECFADESAARVWREHSDDLDLAHVVDRFLDAAAERGVAIERPEDLLHDTAFIEAVSGLYPLRPPRVTRAA